MPPHRAAFIGSEFEQDHPSGNVETQTAFEQDWTVSLHNEQASYLRRTVEWARRLREKFGDVQQAQAVVCISVLVRRVSPWSGYSKIDPREARWIDEP
jgi:hypothetical protein